MKKKLFTLITLALVLIGLIFFVTMVILPKDNNYEGVLVQEETYGGWQQT